MNRKSYILLSIVVGLIIGIVLFFLFRNNSSVNSQSISKRDLSENNKKVIISIDSLFNEKPDSAIYYTRSLLKNDSISTDSSFYYSLIMKIAIYKCIKGEIDSGLNYFSTALNYWEKDSSLFGQRNYGTILNDIAYSYANLGDNEKALTNFKKASDIAAKIGENEMALGVDIQLSSLYQSMGDYGKALESIEKSIQLCYKIKDSVSMISALQSYADLYTNCYLFDEAKTQFDDVLKYKNHFTPYSKFCFYNGKGRMFYLKGDYSNAKQNFQLALKNANPNDAYEFYIPGSNLAETSLLLGEVDSAKVYLDLIQNHEGGLNSFPLIKFNYHSLLGEYYRLKGRYALSQQSFAISDSITKKLDIDKVLLKLHKKRKAKFFEATNQFHEAYLEMKDYNGLNEYILEQNSRNQVAGLKYKYQRDTTVIEQRNDILVSNHRIESLKYRQTIFIVSIVGLLVLIFLIFLFFKKSRALSYEKSMRKMAALKMENIRGRISPHFVFNVLNNIWAIIDDRDTAKAQFDNLINLIRRSLINTETIAIPLSDEIDFVKSYLELERLRMNNNLIVEWKISEMVDLTMLIPGMMLQIPVENAIKHGLAPRIGNKELVISITLDSGFIQLTISDNGIGIQNTPSLTRGTGTGLKVITNTIFILNQNNEKKITYQIQNRKDEDLPGAKVIIRIPTIYNFNL